MIRSSKINSVAVSYSVCGMRPLQLEAWAATISHDPGLLRNSEPQPKNEKKPSLASPEAQ
jgi:hypothetical protein